MKLIEFIYKLIERYVPITKAEVAGLQKEAQEWYDKKAEETKIGKTVKDYSETWWVRTILAVLFIAAQRWIRDFMNPETSVDEDEEDD